MRFLFPLLLVNGILSAQNLVVNPGFEMCSVADSTMSYKRVLATADVEGWYTPTGGTSDQFFIADTNVARTMGHPVPYEGFCYSGIIARQGWYEYLQGTLSEPMKKGKVYRVSFALATEQNRDFNEKRIGIHFSDKRKSSSGVNVFKLDTDISLDTVQDRAISGDWLIYNTYYKAKGGEQCFTIGEFIDIYDFMNPGPASYFYVDSVYIGLPQETEVIVQSADTVVVIDPVPLADTNKIAAGKSITLENIYFETAKSRILPESYQPLNEIIIELKLQPHLKVEIIGHTDKHGTAESNQKLSEQRALAVKEYFVSRGIDASRITTSGRGSSEPVSDDDAKNRRVEFVFSE